MNLDKENIKKLRQLILFTIVILIAFWNYNIIFGWIRFAFGIIFPFLLGGAIAFVLNVPMNFLEEKIFGNRYMKDNYDTDLAGKDNPRFCTGGTALSR